MLNKASRSTREGLTNLSYTKGSLLESTKGACLYQMSGEGMLPQRCHGYAAIQRYAAFQQLLRISWSSKIQPWSSYTLLDSSTQGLSGSNRVSDLVGYISWMLLVLSSKICSSHESVWKEMQIIIPRGKSYRALMHDSGTHYCCIDFIK